MSMLFDATFGTEEIVQILDRMQLNCACPYSNSRRRWPSMRSVSFFAGTMQTSTAATAAI
ncbi:MAG: hypothetical protein OXF56_01220 [Rhodobacteraceae bacterium]|nr:hypothetical protein [Paracoccaceae bacterium]